MEYNNIDFSKIMNNEGEDELLSVDSERDIKRKTIKKKKVEVVKNNYTTDEDKEETEDEEENITENESITEQKEEILTVQDRLYKRQLINMIKNWYADEDFKQFLPKIKYEILENESIEELKYRLEEIKFTICAKRSSNNIINMAKTASTIGEQIITNTTNYNLSSPMSFTDELFNNDKEFILTLKEIALNYQHLLYVRPEIRLLQIVLLKGVLISKVNNQMNGNNQMNNNVKQTNENINGEKEIFIDDEKYKDL